MPSASLRFQCGMVVALLGACSRDSRTPLLLYSPHGRDQLTLLEHEFERRRPDIDVRWLDMGSQEILDRLRFERVNPQADVWFGGPTTLFDRGVQDTLLAPYRPAWADHVGPDGVGPDCSTTRSIERRPSSPSTVARYRRSRLPRIGTTCSNRGGATRCSFATRWRAGRCAPSGG